MQLGELILEEGFAGKSRKRFSTAETEASSPPLPLSPIPEEEDEEAGLLGAPSPTTAKPSDANGQSKDKQPDSPTFSIQTPRPDVLHVRHSEDSLDIDSDRSLQDGPFQVDLEHSQPSRIADSSASDSAGTILGELHVFRVSAPGKAHDI